MTSEHGWWFYLDISPQYCLGYFLGSDDPCRLCQVPRKEHDFIERDDQNRYEIAHAATVEDRKRVKRAMLREQALRKNMDFRPKFSQANQDEAVDAVLNYVTRQAERGGPIFID